MTPRRSSGRSSSRPKPSSTRSQIDPDDPTVSRRPTSPRATRTSSATPIRRDRRATRGSGNASSIPDDRERVLAADAASNTGGERTFSMEYRMIRKDGEVIWVQDEAALVQVGGGTPVLAGVPPRCHGAQGRGGAARASAGGRARGRAAAARAGRDEEHVPAGGVARPADAARRDPGPRRHAGTRTTSELEATTRAISPRRIAENARKLDRLVADLLDMDRLARGIVSPKLESIDVGEVVRRVVAGVGSDRAVARSRSTSDRVVIPVDAPRSSASSRTCSRTPRATRRRTRTSGSPCGAHERGRLIKVEDDGVGVPAELRESIFEPFQQGPDAPQHSPGVGVGLTLVRRFAELHGGRAWIEDRAGGGASFQVFLPGRSPVSATA